MPVAANDSARHLKTIQWQSSSMPWSVRVSSPTARVRGDRVDVVLRTCPFATTALVDPDTVCSMHLGIAEGIAEQTGGRIVVDELVPHDPRRANCRLRMHLEPDHED